MFSNVFECSNVLYCNVQCYIFYVFMFFDLMFYIVYSMFECSILYVLVFYVLIIYVLYFHRSFSSNSSSSSSSSSSVVLFVSLFVFFICIFVHNNKPKNTNSVVKYKHEFFTKVYRNATLSLV